LDGRLRRLRDEYGRKYSGAASSVKDRMYDLYSEYIRDYELTLLEAAAAAAAIDAAFFMDDFDPTDLSPELVDAFERAYPNVPIETLPDMAPERVQGFLNAWKGKYFELLVCEQLNDGEWVGNIHLGPGQVARLAESATERGWDIQILNADGTVDQLLQAKATEDLGYVRDALVRYPGIEVVTTDDVHAASDELAQQIHNFNISDEYLEQVVEKPVESLLDSPIEELAENVLPYTPFVLITITEGYRVLWGGKQLEAAATDFLWRSTKTGAAMGVGALLYLVDAGILSLPASFITRYTLERVRIMPRLRRQLNRQAARVEYLSRAYNHAGGQPT